MTCNTPVPHCLRCSSDGSTCSLCKYGYTLTNSNTECSLCSTSIDFCEHCVSDTQCETCMIGYFSNSSDLCQKCDEGCLTCLTAGTCEVCIDTYVLVGGSCQLCESLIIGCSVCPSSTVCANCIEGYYLAAPSCVPCQNDLDGCDACLSSSVCTLCSMFYELDTVNNECDLCSSLYPNCQICFNGNCI